MSVQFGICNLDGRPANLKQLDWARPMLAPYGPDRERSLCQDNVGIFYRAFDTTPESRSENSPLISYSQSIITWDGRLDNREELVEKLPDKLSRFSTDLEIVSEAYEHWKIEAFAKLIGDWALSIWDPKDRTLILVKDFLGSRPLYYSIEGEQVRWCTILEPLVRLRTRPFELQEEYIAGWLSSFPAPHLTPYVGIDSVPPACFVRLTQGNRYIQSYWKFDSGRQISYRNDQEYEEHFRILLGQSIGRRLRSKNPILAELSGGMDSSSIVCMADDMMASGSLDLVRLETISYYNDAEPNWDERPYFQKVEERRGQTGHHIPLGPSDLLTDVDWSHTMTPADAASLRPSSKRFAACLQDRGYRVVLSGVGGDEVLGGVPTPIPELADLLTQGHLPALVHQTLRWALHSRTPWSHVLLRVGKAFLPQPLVGARGYRPTAPWLEHDFVRRFRRALHGYEERLQWCGPLPSFQANVAALNLLRRQLACAPLSSEPPYEMRYPYLDRELLEFLFAIPREQLVRPGQRRSLMRRGLAGILPTELLQRRRKGFVARSPMLAIVAQMEALTTMSENLASHFIDRQEFMRALQAVHQGQEIPIVSLIRTIETERWLKHATQYSLLSARDTRPNSVAISFARRESGTERSNHQVQLASRL